MIMNEIKQKKELETHWPEDELESVPACPVCGDRRREVLHEGLTDRVFFCAPGAWTMWRCGNCLSGYLDPRPTPASIGRAYAEYCTHQNPPLKAVYSALSPLRKIRRRLVNGYTNWRFHTCAVPSSMWGIPLFFFLWPQRIHLDHEYRNIPHSPMNSNDGTLLDIGCGNGLFLKIAQTCGYTVTGLDPDIKSVNIGRKQGLNIIHGGIEQFDGQDNLFDIITLSHVIEHVHDPLVTLQACHRLLKSGGLLWIETPNISSLGHHCQGCNWFHLDSPRHLILFNLRSLKLIIERVGFNRITQLPIPNPLPSVMKASESIRRGLPFRSDINLSWRQRIWLFYACIIETCKSETRDLLLIKASK